jgi:hypothetical protein
MPVEFAEVFLREPFAAGTFEPVRDFDAWRAGRRFVQSKDKVSGLPLWQVDTIDADPAARDRTVRVKVAASDQQGGAAGTAIPAALVSPQVFKHGEVLIVRNVTGEQFARLIARVAWFALRHPLTDIVAGLLVFVWLRARPFRVCTGSRDSGPHLAAFGCTRANGPIRDNSRSAAIRPGICGRPQ